MTGRHGIVGKDVPWGGGVMVGLDVSCVQATTSEINFFLFE